MVLSDSLQSVYGFTDPIHFTDLVGIQKKRVHFMSDPIGFNKVVLQDNSYYFGRTL